MSANPHAEIPMREQEQEAERETARLMLRTDQLTPLYDEALFIFTWGFRIGAALLALGIVVALIRQEPLGHEAARYGDVLPAVMAGRASGIIDLAILWFMATPVVTVLVVAASFWRLGDRRYTLLSLVVLAILGVSIGLALYR